jgi:fatty-acyl-CoA synthase
VETPLTPLDFLRRARKLHTRREAVVDGDTRLTYAEFGSRCDRWSAALQVLGVRQGDRVATIALNTHQHLEQYYAVPQIGAVIVPLNHRLTAENFVYLLNHSGATIVCVHPDFTEAVDSVRHRLNSVRHFVTLDNGSRPGWLAYERLIASSSGHFRRPAIAETDPISINYTSGTTAKPKGVVITHRNAWINCIGTLTHWPVGVKDRYLWTVPMFHANGWTYTWTITAAGATHVCLHKCDVKQIYEQIARERVTLLCAAPTVLIGIANGPEQLRRQLPRGVRLMTGGAPPAAATIERIEGELGWELTQIYGLTETSPFISICAPLPEHDALCPADRAVVKARQGVEFITSGELRVVDEQLRDVPRDGQTIGEIVARGNTVMTGYFNDPEATLLAFAGGWFHSGDAAVVHPDGYIEIRDRFKDVIISGGENISSIEVEGALLRHPAVLEVAVVGVPHDKWGESPSAFVVKRPGMSASESDLRNFARGTLAHFKVPTSFRFVEALPKTATGKIQKFVLRGGRVAIAHQ